MRGVELYAGGGGAALGLSRAGVHSLALVERDPHACATLRAAGLGPVVESDVQAVDWSGCEAVDLLWASPPCQPWSTAGKRQGERDERDLWPATVEVLDDVRPRWVLVENVRGLTHHRSACNGVCVPGCGARYLEDEILAALRERYAEAEWRVLDCADYGVPQHRHRLFVVAGPARIGWPLPTHAAPGDMWLRPWVSIGEALGINGRCIGAGSNPHGPGREHERNYRDITEEPAPVVASAQVGNRGPWIDYPGHRANHLDEPAQTVNGVGGGELLVEDRPDWWHRSSGVEGPARASDATGRRRLTVEECAVLQGFPRDWPFQGTKTARYRQVGNAVPPVMAELLARAVREADE